LVRQTAGVDFFDDFQSSDLEFLPDASKTFPSSCLPDHLAKHANPMEEIGGCFAPAVQWSVT